MTFWVIFGLWCSDWVFLIGFLWVSEDDIISESDFQFCFLTLILWVAIWCNFLASKVLPTAVRSAPPRVTDSDCQSDMMLQMAVFTEAFSHVHIQQPSFRFPFQIHILFHSDSLQETFIQIHKNLSHSDLLMFCKQPWTCIDSCLCSSFVVSYRPCPLSNKCQSCVLKLNGNVPHQPLNTSHFPLSSFSDTVA